MKPLILAALLVTLSLIDGATDVTPQLRGSIYEDVTR